VHFTNIKKKVILEEFSSTILIIKLSYNSELMERKIEYSFLLFFILAGSVLSILLSSPVSADDEPDFVQELFNLINEERIEKGLNPLAWDNRLEAAAQLHSEDMATQGALSHTGSDGSDFRQRAEDQGYGMASGEVVAFGATSANSVLALWLDSPPHTDMILGEHKHVGIGLAYPPSSYYWTVDFGNLINTAELTISVVGSGETSPIAGVYSHAEGTEVTVSASPDSGWTFHHWLLDSEEDGNANPRSITVDDDLHLTAVFVEDQPWILYIAIIVIILIVIGIIVYFLWGR